MIPMLRRRLMSGGGAFEFTYTGHFTDKIEGTNRVIKFTSSGTLNVSGSVVADVYLLAGGGGGAVMGNVGTVAGGGGGGNNSFDVVVNAGEYKIVVGKGGTGSAKSYFVGDEVAAASAGGDTSAFGSTVTGGTGAVIAGSSNPQAGIGGQPNGSNGQTASAWAADASVQAEGGSPNGGAAERANKNSYSAHNGGDGYITLTIPA